jgi:hypothetical protein
MPRLPFLSHLLPYDLEPGIVLVEFDPQSLWYETSFTVAAHALRSGVRTEYHSFTHLPAEIDRILERLGIDTPRLGARGLFEIMDSYTVTTGLGMAARDQSKDWWIPSSTVTMRAWDAAIDESVARVRKGDYKGSGGLHIDDNTSVLLEHNSESEVIAHWRKKIIPHTREGEITYVNAIMRGVGSETFVKQFESLADAIIDFKSEEVSGRIEHRARARMIRGKDYNSEWRPLGVTGIGEVRFSGTGALREFEFRNQRSSKVFDCLVDALVGDHMVSGYGQEMSGWRTLSEISRATGIPTSVLYGPGGVMGPIFSEISQRGLIEVKRSPGERGRGGTVTRVRLAYGKEPIRAFFNERVKTKSAKSS